MRSATESSGRHPAIRIGTAGWSVAARHAAAFPAEGSHLERYTGRLDAVEINSSFYRPHQRKTYERWADSTPPQFRFAVKVPKAITHEKRLRDCAAELDRFTDEAGGLGDKLGVLLVQLPPSLAFDAPTAAAFFAALHARASHAAIACEPRHASWFTANADGLLRERQVARVAADPPRPEGAGEPGGWRGLAYYRLHGAPRMYYSDYNDGALTALAARLSAHRKAGIPAWCIFDNTAAMAALGNAVVLSALVADAAKAL